MFFNIGFASKRRVCRFFNLVLGFGDKRQGNLEERFEGLGRRFMTFIHKSKSSINVFAQYIAMLVCIICCQSGHYGPLGLAWDYWVLDNTQYVRETVMIAMKLLKRCNRAWFSKICCDLFLLISPYGLVRGFLLSMRSRLAILDLASN